MGVLARSVTWLASGRTRWPVPQQQQQRSRRILARASMTAELDKASSVPAIATRPTNSNFVTSSPSSATASPYIQPSAFSRQLHAHTTQPTPTATATPMTTSAVQELEQRQDALRDVFDYAHQHHNVSLRKDPALYQRERRAFAAAHGRVPTLREVSRRVRVSLPPVAALKAYAHLDPAKSPLHAQVQDALLLQQHVMRRQLAQSNERVRVRCLRCFHVYATRMPALRQDAAMLQSWDELAKAQSTQRAAEQLARRPGLRKQRYSVGRRATAAREAPTRCPMCGSPRAQWLMEYVHYRTHATTKGCDK